MSRFDLARRRMIEIQLADIDSAQVLSAMTRVLRHEFVSPALQSRAYEDGPLPIACRQTISQPWIVARMTELLDPQPDDVVLEIGTGSGYQTAVLAQLCAKVISVERHGDLAREAQRRLERLGIRNVTVLAGDGTMGRSELAPFDGILVTAGAPEAPAPLAQQLREGGRMVVPVGSHELQTLIRIERVGAEDDPFHEERFEACRFVPLLGRFGWKDSP